jgi:hypothetical protein
LPFPFRQLLHHGRTDRFQEDRAHRDLMRLASKPPSPGEVGEINQTITVAGGSQVTNTNADLADRKDRRFCSRGSHRNVASCPTPRQSLVAFGIYT